MSKETKIALIGLILIAAALRMRGLFAVDLHPDEALFGSWARLIAVWKDPLLTTQSVDKPPLVFYLQALFFPLLGPTSIAARLPSFLASLVLIPLTAILAWRLYRQKALAVLAAVVVAFSPLAIQIGVSAFVDPVMIAFVTAALVATVGPETRHDQANRSTSDAYAVIVGLLFGLAAAAKYQAWLFLPLILSFGHIRGWRRKQWFRWLMGSIPILLTILIWDLIQDDKLSLIQLQWSSYGGLRIIRSWELWPRLSAWSEQWALLFGSLLLIQLLFAGSLYLLVSRKNIKYEAVLFDRVLVIFLGEYFLLHWFIAVPVWDRYILAVLPIASIVIGRVVFKLVSRLEAAQESFSSSELPIKGILSLLFSLIFIILILPNISAAAKGELQVESSVGIGNELSELSTYLEKLPAGTVLYDHWFSWQLRYFTFDDQILVNWFPDPESLTLDLRIFGFEDQPRLVILPQRNHSKPVERAITKAGFKMKKAAHDSDTIDSDWNLYYLVPIE